MESLRGQLLIASPQLVDPNFARTVVLITEHNDEGAMGIVLNRPSTAAVVEAAPELEQLVEPDDDVFVGGPVQPSSVIVLAEWEHPDDGVPVFGHVGFVAAGADPDELATTVKRARLFAGFAGWASGQLEAELERDDWILEQARPDDVFALDPDVLWSEVLERKGGEYALVARMPLDPSLN